MAMANITFEMKKEAELEIRKQRTLIKFDTKDYPVELLVQKFKSNEFFIPYYQRAFIWKKSNKSQFIESVLLGLPIPFMFLGQCENGKMEIIDGAQRIQTLCSFLDNEFRLSGLKKLTLLNKFKFSDLPTAQQRKFQTVSFRIIVLEDSTTNEVRQDLFNRINTTSVKANDSEIRRGSYVGKFTSFIEECSKDELFLKLCPISGDKENRHERFELVLRFFAYLNGYETFKHSVQKFLDQYLQANLEDFPEDEFRAEFSNMLNFINKTFPFGFAKMKNSKTTPRVRFEALAIGSALALRKNHSLQVDNIDWLESDAFKEITTSDASNNTDKLKKRIEYVRDILLENSLCN